MLSLTTEYTFYAKTLVGVLAIVDPLGTLPIFLTLCGGRSLPECQQIARTSAFAVAIILIVSIWGGDAILSFFGINISAFRVGGGILILLMAINMLHARQHYAKQSPEEMDEMSSKESIAIVPLALPLLAGPGAISLVIINAHQIGHWGGRLILSAGMLGVAIVVWLILRLAVPIGGSLGITGLNVATRVMGLLLTAIGVQMITSGLVVLLPGLA